MIGPVDVFFLYSLAPPQQPDSRKATTTSNSAIVRFMKLEQIVDYLRAGLVLQAVFLIDQATNNGGTEMQIDNRIATMDQDDLIVGVARGIRLMQERPDIFEDDLHEEITDFLREQD